MRTNFRGESQTMFYRGRVHGFYVELTTAEKIRKALRYFWRLFA